MSLVGTLAKVAVGIAVAKGMKSVVGGGGARQSGGGGLGDLLGGALGGGASKGGGAGGGLGLENMMDVLKGNQSGGGASTGGLGDILGQLGGAAGGAAGGGLGGLGDLLTNALENKGSVTKSVNQNEDEAAGLMIRAMLQAAKSDGSVDESEKQKLLGNLGELSQDEANFINQELGRDIDVQGLANDVPAGMQKQVYMMSLLGIDLDTQNEASYLNDLAGAMGLGRSDVNQIHEMVGVQPLYR